MYLKSGVTIYKPDMFQVHTWQVMSGWSHSTDIAYIYIYISHIHTPLKYMCVCVCVYTYIHTHKYICVCVLSRARQSGSKSNLLDKLVLFKTSLKGSLFINSTL